ncbi:MAG: hypothetical protein ACRDOV_00715, partial [Streptomyces sp.]
QLIGAVAAATAVRVFAPDAARLVRRGLAAGVMVGVASLTEQGPTAHPPHQTTSDAIQAGRGERS